ncbi:hypothetical protein RF55_8377 [Lasius niger]|uniref:Uncharacterized protein n=1 Tax=Lasius niger TaxID=67767 RepID=A0A0J7NGR5_LASNI|nr:hypothetical protein RF55_8377 [Lasius niger]
MRKEGRMEDGKMDWMEELVKEVRGIRRELRLIRVEINKWVRGVGRERVESESLEEAGREKEEEDEAKESEGRESQDVKKREEEEEVEKEKEKRDTGKRAEGEIKRVGRENNEERGSEIDEKEKEGGSWWSNEKEEEEEKDGGEWEIWKKLEERAEKERRRRERERAERERKEEQVRREMRRRNVIWRGIEGDSPEERSRMMIMLAERVLGRKVKVRGVEERIGEGGKEILLVIMEMEEDKEELLEKSGEIRRKWEIIVDEDLTWDERRLKWRIAEKARVERRRGRKVVNDNRRIWIEGKEWKWDEEEERWKEWEGEEDRKGEKGEGKEREGKGMRRTGG